MGNSNSSDPPDAVVNEHLLKKLEKENSFLREDLWNKNVMIKTLIKNISDLNKEIIIYSFSYNQYVTENSIKDVDTKSYDDTNVQRTSKTTPQKTFKTSTSNVIPLKNSCKIHDSNNEILSTDSNIDNNNK